MDFNTAESQRSFGLIPKGTIAKVRMTIKPGGFNDPARDWTGGYATHNTASGSVYLNCEFVIMEGQYAKRKVWSLIGLHSPKGDKWNGIGRSFIRAILNSARGFAEDDDSPQALAARNANFAELDGIEFIARIDVEKNQETAEERNVIKIAITKGHKDYDKGSMQVELQAALCDTAPSDIVPSWAR